MGGATKSDEKSELAFELSFFELVKIDMSINCFNFFEFWPFLYKKKGDWKALARSNKKTKLIS